MTKLVSLGVNQLAHQILQVVSIANEVLCQFTQQRRMRGLQCPRCRRRIVFVQAHWIEEIGRIDDANSEEFLPQVVDGRARKLKISSHFPSQCDTIVLAGSRAASTEWINRRHVRSTTESRRLARRTVASGRIQSVVLQVVIADARCRGFAQSVVNLIVGSHL